MKVGEEGFGDHTPSVQMREFTVNGHVQTVTAGDMFLSTPFPSLLVESEFRVGFLCLSEREHPVPLD